jgi:hypothetical protein
MTKAKKTKAKKARVKHATMKVTAKKCKTTIPSGRLLSGYEPTESGLYIRPSTKPIPPNKLRAGFAKAKNEIKRIVDDITGTLTGDYVISEISLSASFSADGKFLGFGVGGAGSITIKIIPS